nr:EOG090X0FVK [Leptodora kindtii]
MRSQSFVFAANGRQKLDLLIEAYFSPVTKTINELSTSWSNDVLKGNIWKNPPAKPNAAYVPTTLEHLANILTHGVCVLPAIYAMWPLLERASNTAQFWAAFIYGAALIMLFSVSALFHTCCLCSKSRIRDWFHRGDRAMIYLFIASSYFPWLSLVPCKSPDAHTPPSSMLPTVLSWFGINSVLAADLRWTVWFLAAMGILYQQIFHEKYKWLETFFYVLVSLVPSIPFLHQEEMQGMWELKIGGMFYLIGIIFFKSDGRIPFAHAIWHLHVAVGASIHYYAVSSYLMG